MCLNPIVIKNVRYYKREPTPFGSHIPVPCGQCVQCKENYISASLGRLTAHSWQFNGYALFLTLTIDDRVEKVDITYPGVKREHVIPLQKAIQYRNECGKNFSYFFTAEYGSETQRPHYHALMFGFENPLELEDIVSKYYKTGQFMISEATEARFRYVANSHISKCSYVPWYCPDLSDGILEKCNKPFVISSRGLAHKFVDANFKEIRETHLLNINGMHFPLHSSLVHYMATKLHCSDCMVFYDRNKRLMESKILTSLQHDDLKVMQYLGIDYSNYNFTDIYSDKYRLEEFSRYINQLIHIRERDFLMRYSQKKCNTLHA